MSEMGEATHSRAHYRIVPITLRQAKRYVEEKHRHHGSPVGWKYGIGLRNVDDELVGVIIVGRPVGRGYDDGFTVEVTRCCTDGSKNACSALYGAARRAAKALGFKRIITYTMESEEGTSLKAAGWALDGYVYGRSWSTPSRPREDVSPTCGKHRWISNI